MQAVVAIFIGSLAAVSAYLVLEASHLRQPLDPAVLEETEQLVKRWCSWGAERPSFDWERPLGALMLMLGSTGLVLAVIPVPWPNGTRPDLPNQLNLARWLLVAMVPIGLLMVSLAMSRLRHHNNPRVRCLADCTVGLPGHAVDTRAGRGLVLALGLSVAFGAATWDVLAKGDHLFAPTVSFTPATPPWVGPLVLVLSLVGSWVLALGAVALTRTPGLSKRSGVYLLGGVTIAILVLGAWRHRETLQQLPCVVARGPTEYIAMGPGGWPICVGYPVPVPPAPALQVVSTEISPTSVKGGDTIDIKRGS